jgi:hypothetical protein
LDVRNLDVDVEGITAWRVQLLAIKNNQVYCWVHSICLKMADAHFSIWDSFYLQQTH